MKRQIFLMLVLIFLFSSCIPEQPVKEVRGVDFTSLDTIPLEFFGIKDKNRGNSSSSNINKYASLFANKMSADECLNIFADNLDSARISEDAPQLFSAFSNSRCITLFNRSDSVEVKVRKRIQKRWVDMAMSEKDESIKVLFSNYAYRILKNRNVNIYSYQKLLRPGNPYKLNGYFYNRSGSEWNPIMVELGRMKLSKHLKPEGFETISTDTITSDHIEHRNINYDIIPDKPGVYRVTLYNDSYYNHFYFQSTWLDGMVKHDNDKIVVWGSSYKDTVDGPYSVYFVSPKGDVVSVKSDSSGVAAIAHPLGQGALKTNRQQNMNIFIRKGDEVAFLDGALNMGGFPKDSSVVNYLYTDRPVYRPGDKVRFQGISKLFAQEMELAPSNVDSIHIMITDPQNTEVFSKMISVDQWGHSGDSITLSKTAKQGIYNVGVSSAIKRDGDKSHYMALSYHYEQSASFVVEAYKKPEFRIELSEPAKYYGVDDTIKIDVKGEYYFGGALANTPVKVRWYRQQMYHGYYSRKGGRRISFYPGGGKQFFLEEDARLDSEGKLTLKHKPTISSDQEFITAEVIATDKSRRQIRSEVSLKVVKSKGYLTITPNKYQYELDEEGEIDFLAVDLDGEPLKEPLDIRIKKGRQIVLDTTLQSNSEGAANLTYLFKELGRFTIEAVTKDPDGKSIFREHHVSVVKRARWNWEWERIEISLDKEHYSFGDTAVISVKTGADKTNAFCSVEGRAINEVMVKRIEDNLITYQLPITENLGHNIQFFTGFSGKTKFASQSKGIVVVDSSSLLNVSLSGEKNLKPGDTFQGELTVTDAEGQPVEAQFSAALVDEAIFAVAKEARKNGNYRNRYNYYYNRNNAVKEGILRIFPQNFRNRIYPKFNKFETSYIASLYSLSGVIEETDRLGMDMLAEKKEMSKRSLKPAYAKTKSGTLRGGKGGGFAESDELLGALMGGGGSSVSLKKRKGVAPKPIRERKDFKDIGYWNGALKTDNNGKTDLSFTMPDDLTKWRLVLIGSDGVSRLIDFRDSLITKQDIMVKLQAPRSVVEEDSLVVSSVVHNYSGKDIEATVTLHLKGDTTTAEILSEKTVVIPMGNGETKSVDWNLKILKKGKFTCYSSVTSDAGDDAESRNYPILINGIPRTVSSVGMLGKGENAATIDLSLPKDGLQGSREVTLTWSPSLARSLFESLDYLTGYPYGCVEQTMSRFLPNLYVASVMKRLNLPNDSLMAKMPEYTDKGLERLNNFQHSDGGWGWWENDKTDPRMTALVVYGLSYASKTEITAEQRGLIKKMLENGVPAAQALLMEKSQGLEQRVSLAHALVNYYGKKTPRNIANAVESIYREKGKLSTGSLARILDISSVVSLSIDRDDLISLIESKGNISSGSAYWEGSSRYRWYRQSEETTARVLRALTAADPSNENIEKAVMWLSRQKRKGYWVSTKTTAVVIEALSYYLEKSGEFDPDYTAVIQLDGRTLKEVNVTKENMGAVAGEITLAEHELSKAGKLSLKLNGKGRLYYSVNLRYVTDEKPILKHNNGVSVTRSYKKLKYSKKRSGDWVVERVPFTGTCKSGDEIEVTVTVKSGRALEHLMLEDYFPSGMEVLKKPQEWYNRWCGWWYRGYTHKEARDDRMVFFMSDLHAGTQTFSYLLRAETPGKFTALPARAECMYEPEVNGNSTSRIVTITE